MKEPQSCIVEENRMVASGTYLMRLRCAHCQDAFMPGQFLHILVPDRPDLVLRRPISIHEYDEVCGEMTVIYQVKGEGTRVFSHCRQGDALSVLGPLGHGFPVLPQAKRCILVGGGIGCAPLLALTKAMPDTAFDAALGFRNMAYIYQKDLFEKACRHVIWTTDDGSFGCKGTATEALRTLFDQPCDAVYACGPIPMLKSLQAMIKGTGAPCYASLEERMGCGIGACMTCACVVMENGKRTHQRVCKDGPVFSLEEVVF